MLQCFEIGVITNEQNANETESSIRDRATNSISQIVNHLNPSYLRTLIFIRYGDYRNNVRMRLDKFLEHLNPQVVANLERFHATVYANVFSTPDEARQAFRANIDYLLFGGISGGSRIGLWGGDRKFWIKIENFLNFRVI